MTRPSNERGVSEHLNPRVGSPAPLFLSIVGSEFARFASLSKSNFRAWEAIMVRAELGVDGNCGFALLGENIQEGEAEFVKIDTAAPIGTSDWHRAAVRAATMAYRALKARLPDQQFSYYIGPSHPNHC